MVILQIVLNEVVDLREGSKLQRDQFLGLLWDLFGDRGLSGIHEGTVLADEAAERGWETESFVVDAAEAPANRDWIGRTETLPVQLYFNDMDSAQIAYEELKEQCVGLTLSEPIKQEERDWDAEWKKSFTGMEVLPHWHVLPPWMEGMATRSRHVLMINPGAGFGTGTHETTRLCLEAIAECEPILKQGKALDFGSGSGILSIACAMLGAQVDGVEIDPLAVRNAEENALLNHELKGRVDFRLSMDGLNSAYDVVVANILRPILIQFADELVKRLLPSGALILSGLIENDLKEIQETFSRKLPASFGTPDVRAMGEWRALLWRSR